MEIKKLHKEFSICKVEDYSLVKLDAAYCFIEKTDTENSLVCRTEDVPANAIQREDGWKGLRIQGELAFSLVGILSRLSAILAERAVPIFAVSTYNTDYIFVKKEQYQKALEALGQAGYRIVD